MCVKLSCPHQRAPCSIVHSLPPTTPRITLCPHHDCRSPRKILRDGQRGDLRPELAPALAAMACRMAPPALDASTTLPPSGSAPLSPCAAARPRTAACGRPQAAPGASEASALDYVEKPVTRGTVGPCVLSREILYAAASVDA